ncbi:MAG: hypothetical protein EZS28_041311, partial [Streblomastix strix]
MIIALALIIAASAEITNERVVREIDIHGNIAYAHYLITFVESEIGQSVSSYSFRLEFPIETVASISFWLGDTQLDYTSDERKKNYAIQIPSKIKGGNKVTLEAQILIINWPKPKPKEVLQDMRQGAYVDGNAQFSSPYATTLDELYII